MTENLSRKTAVELASLIATKAVSPVEVLDAHLATIARVNPKLNAIVTLVADGALVFGTAGRSRGDARRKARIAAWIARCDQGRDADRRHSHHLWLATVQG
jgi:Asp-tRNA(Asn)/Glu-tRNA(Gln) amidotransferase A subunit family amidase